MNRRSFLSAAGSGAGLLALRARAAARPVNFLMLFIDNVGYGDLGCYGNQSVKTPHIDRLAAEGARCTQCYVASPSCMPSRGALLTGRHPVRNGLTQQLWREPSTGQMGLPHREKLWPQYLKPLGYATGCFGKWNIGFMPGSRPTERGFDEYLGNISGNFDYYTHVYNGVNDLYRRTEPVEIPGYSTDLFADAACDFIRRNADRPFFCYVPFNAAHFPNPKNKAEGAPCIWQAPDEYFRLHGYGPDTRNEPERYRAVLSALDAGIGRVVGQLDALGLRENTIVVVLSDNGVFMLPGRGLECGSNAPLREGGVTMYEGGLRVPCIVRWPGHIPEGSVCDAMLSSMDFMVMSLRAAGAPLPKDRALDGADPTPALTGTGPAPHRELFFYYEQGRAIRQGRYKLLRPKNDAPWELYGLDTDLGETTDLASAKPSLAARLQRRYEDWYTEASAETRSSA